jgi:hypothetical protein
MALADDWSLSRAKVNSAALILVDDPRKQAQHAFIEPRLGLKICKGGEHDAT